MEDFFGCKTVSVIPNALIVDTAIDDTMATEPARRFVFLGRLHPVKGVDLLIEAFGNARLDDDWELVIAGPEDVPAYAIQLKARAAKSPRAARIHFTGPIYGPEKISLLRSAWAVVVPSRTEVIGMVNLESASLATPTITTPNTGLDEWSEVGGMLTENNASDLQAALQVCAVWSINERMRRGHQIRDHVLQHYSLDSVGHEWLRLYRGAESTSEVY